MGNDRDPRASPFFVTCPLCCAQSLCLCPSKRSPRGPGPGGFPFSCFVTCPLLPFLALAAQVEAKPLDQTITLASASRLITKVVGDQFTKPPWQGTLARALEWCTSPRPLPERGDSLILLLLYSTA